MSERNKYTGFHRDSAKPEEVRSDLEKAMHTMKDQDLGRFFLKSLLGIDPQALDQLSFQEVANLLASAGVEDEQEQQIFYMRVVGGEELSKLAAKFNYKSASPVNNKLRKVIDKLLPYTKTQIEKRK